MINDLPPAPSRGDDPDVFVGRADAFLAALPAFGSQATDLAGKFNLVAGIGLLGYLPPVAYQAGISLTVATQTVQFGSSTYAPILTALPFTTSGTFEADKFRLVEGISRPELRSSAGSNLVGHRSRSLDAKLTEFLSILDCGGVGDGVQDDLGALLEAKSHGSFIRFPRVDVAETTYYLGGFSAGELDGLTFIADEGVTLSFAIGQYNFYNKIKCASDIKVHFRDVNVDYVFTKTRASYRKSSPTIPPPAMGRRRIALDCTDTTQVNLRRVGWPTADQFTAASGSTAQNYAILDAASGVFQGAFVELGAFETVSGYFENGLVSQIGIIIRGSLGYSILYATSPTANFVAAKKLTGQPIADNSPNLPWTALGQGRYTSFAPDRSIWSVTKVGAGRVIVKLNGRAVTQPYAPYVGDVFEIGFVCFGVQFMVSGLTLERRTDAVMGMPPLGPLSIWGDSTAESLPSSWDTYMKDMLDGLYGVKVGRIKNNAVSGQNLGQQLALMNSIGFGDAYYVILCIGTNDIQGDTGVIALIANLNSAIDLIHVGGRRAVIVTPWMWYTRAQSGGFGQASINYDIGAKYRMAMERVAFERGAVLINTNAELPNPDPSLLDDEPGAALLRDNIHQDVLGNQLYGTAIGKGMMDDYLSMPCVVEEAPAAALMLDGATAGASLRITYSKDGLCSINGEIVLNGIEGGDNLMRVPRYISPTHDVILMAIATSETADLGMVRVFVRPGLGAMQIANIPAGTTRIFFVGGSWKASASY